MTKVQSVNENQIWFDKGIELVDQNITDSLTKIFNLQLPEILSPATSSRSTTSSACPSDDSGIERTLNLSPVSPQPEDTDSDDTQSFGGFEIHRTSSRVQLRQPSSKLGNYPNFDISNYAESAQFSPSGSCTAATREECCCLVKKSKPNNNGNRFQLLSYEQVAQLHDVMSKTIPIHSRNPGSPTIWVRLNKLFRTVRENLQMAGIPVRDIRLNGGAASYVIGKERFPAYNDVDVLISVDLSSNSSTIQKVKSAVLDALMSFLPENKNSGSPHHCLNDVNSNFSLISKSGGFNGSTNESQLASSKTFTVNDVNSDNCVLTSNASTESIPSLSRKSDYTKRNESQHTSHSQSKIISDHNLNSSFRDTCDSFEFPQFSNREFYGSNHSSRQYLPQTGHSFYNNSPNLVPNIITYNWHNSGSIPSGVHPDSLTFRESYVYKQFRKFSQNDDCWSLLSLGVPSGGSKVIELKFVDRMKRQFEFTVDSFQIILDPLLSFYETNHSEAITPNFYPSVVAESVSGSFSNAFYHLENKLIATSEPEMIRGGGLLKYCRLLVNGYKPAEGVDVCTLEKYMSSRFFIDFQEINSQYSKLEAFLANHFTENEVRLKIEYLKTLYRVVSGSTICLMSQEHYQTLNLIASFLHYFMCRSQFTPSLNLEWFAEQQNLVLDKIYFGRELFPVIARSGTYPPTCFCTESRPHPQISHIPGSQFNLNAFNDQCPVTPLTVEVPSDSSSNEVIHDSQTSLVSHSPDLEQTSVS